MPRMGISLISELNVLKLLDGFLKAGRMLKLDRQIDKPGLQAGKCSE
jgi:hypothetical protein